MIANQSNLKAIVAATLLTVTISMPLAISAGENSQESDLLAQLISADADAARSLDRELQALWRKSGSAAMDLLLSRATKAMAAGDLPAALEHLTALTDHAPDFARGWYERARAYHAIGAYGPSVADLERALALNPNDYNAIYALGTVFEQFRDPKRAYEAYLRAKAIHPHHEEVLSALERLRPEVAGKDL
ncbi:tetratricopeptide repeat protein [Pseudophaeobacter sp. EL27]|uniref:tetratricopeptide repeat protein n=1 Tax=Pseudophaeobacter sp. EL27 TaxID=2107580 RepID=UPI000EFCC978|nr:tetratricopeptide repeat protein [Pseudophaeobacter sp. EL27]